MLIARMEVVLWITATLLVCSAQSRYTQPALQDSYIQSPDGNRPENEALRSPDSTVAEHSQQRSDEDRERDEEQADDDENKYNRQAFREGFSAGISYVQWLLRKQGEEMRYPVSLQEEKEEKEFPVLEVQEEKAEAAQITVCNRQFPSSVNEYISYKFFRDHICLLKNSNQEPTDIDALCRDFRNIPVNTVMVLTSQDLNRMHNDIGSHQYDFYYYLYLNRYYRPTFYTDTKYNFIECTRGKGKKSYGYEQYGVKLNGYYQIYHGCAPVGSKPYTFFNRYNC